MSRAVWSQTLDGLKGWWLSLTVESAVRGTVRSRDGGREQGSPDSQERRCRPMAVTVYSGRSHPPLQRVCSRSFLCHSLHGAVPTTFRRWNITHTTTFPSIHTKLAVDVIIYLISMLIFYIDAFLIWATALPLQAS